jgi:hypothetical protein
MEMLDPLRCASKLIVIYRFAENDYSLSEQSEAGELPVSVQIYRNSLIIKETHCLEPVVNFLYELAWISNRAIRTILKAGSMDLLLHLYVSNFSDPITTMKANTYGELSTLETVCNGLLDICSSTPKALKFISKHPLYPLWPKYPELPFTIAISDRPVQRAATWRSIDPEFLVMRLRHVFNASLMEDGRSFLKQDHLDDVVADALEVYR